jgi:hypothetical protein
MWHGWGKEGWVQVIGIKARRKETTRKNMTYVDYIKVYLEDMGWACVFWIEPVQYKNKWRALANAVVNRRVP